MKLAGLRRAEEGVVRAKEQRVASSSVDRHGTYLAMRHTVLSLTTLLWEVHNVAFNSVFCNSYVCTCVCFFSTRSSLCLLLVTPWSMTLRTWCQLTTRLHRRGSMPGRASSPEPGRETPSRRQRCCKQTGLVKSMHICLIKEGTLPESWRLELSSWANV